MQHSQAKVTCSMHTRRNNVSYIFNDHAGQRSDPYAAVSEVLFGETAARGGRVTAAGTAVFTSPSGRPVIVVLEGLLASGEGFRSSSESSSANGLRLTSYEVCLHEEHFSLRYTVRARYRTATECEAI